MTDHMSTNHYECTNCRKPATLSVVLGDATIHFCVDCRHVMERMADEYNWGWSRRGGDNGLYTDKFDTHR
jgi:predicted nucleic acid-binding Zn ribbon protein